ncbi:hypothetical protein QNI16_36330 [Cytophagaceae bacterium YF14B1]|uniref:Uncharacterized protein n=1 Tax=Xanthocytophaga flava TaxID=3048013 RepID=A0AAE3QVZ1_9BACT|nr:hypothetical protein [Xanthocytophaga flavus]MDJ1486006.1 hypothetical protein [Xanthocytophaga flavus]
MQLRLLLSALCFVFGLAIGVFTENRLNPVEVYECETIDYAQIESIVAKQVATHSVQPLDVEKIKHVKSFTYAPVFQVMDTCKGP